jgi:hypothetical protein
MQREFKVGKHVLLKVKYKKISLKLWSFQKIGSIYCGQFQILEWISPIAYLLAIPTSVCIDNVFHVSFLKKYVLDVNQEID